MKVLRWLALLLVVAGASNWVLISFFDFDFVAALFSGQNEPASPVVYAIVALVGVVLLVTSSAILARKPHDRYANRRDRVTSGPPPPTARTRATR